VKIVGHKGGGSTVPENSRTALEHALSLGLDAVEIDIWPTADRRFALFHDADIARLTGHAGWTMHLTSDQLRTLEIGSRVSTEYAGERILLLEEALDLIAGKADLFLEVKRTRHELDRYIWVEERLSQILHDCGAVSWTTVISFDHRTLLNLQETSHDVRLGMLYAGEWLSLEQEMEALNPVALLPHWAQTTPALVNDAHSSGIAVYPWVVNNDQWMQEFSRMGVDGIITDRPEALIKLQQTAGRTTHKTESEGSHD